MASNEARYLRIKQIIGGDQPLIPISRSGWFQGIREGRYPSGVLLSPRVRVWLASDIAALIEKGAL